MKKLLLLTFGLLIMHSLTGCGSVPETPPISEKSNAELIQLLETFEYENEETSIYPFYEIVEELEIRGPSVSEAAPMLAKMIAFNGSTSVTASHPLVVMGPSAQSAIPYLLQNLSNPREDVRRYSIFVLGIIGEPAKCAIPEIASHLWSADYCVRSAAAGALTEITNTILVESELYKLDATMPGSVPCDGEDFSVSKIARDWWQETGQYIEWEDENCTLLE